MQNVNELKYITEYRPYVAGAKETQKIGPKSKIPGPPRSFKKDLVSLMRQYGDQFE